MKRHLAYLKYVVRHKWFVWKACRILEVPRWQSLIHDWHKFLPSEWFPYAETFYAPDGSKQYIESPEFTKAWNLHQKRGKHHWQHWLITWDRGVTEPLRMEHRFVIEMVADWYGAGRAITGKWEAHDWYFSNKEKIQLHPETRREVEQKLEYMEVYFRRYSMVIGGEP